MTLYEILLCLIFVFLFSLGMSYYLISFAKKRNILDVPNDRSSHTAPTPRGGGVTIAISIIGYIYLAGLIDLDGVIVLGPLGVTALLIALVAIVDDMRGLGAITRAGLYLISACLFVIMSNDALTSDLMIWTVIIFTALAITWITNLYNFMDGADGIAAIQAIIATLPIGIYLFLSGHIAMAVLCFVIATSTLGFLVWNWAPAKIFMGDVGSCTLGFVFGCMIYTSYNQEILSPYLWFILLSSFIVDATLTLIKRILTREKWYQAHHSHSYQRYLQIGHSHRGLAINFTVWGVFVLWPLSYLVYIFPHTQLHITIIVYVSLSGLWYFTQYVYDK